MLTLERVGRHVRALPLVVRLGLIVLVVGGLADVAAHLDAADHAGHLHEHVQAEFQAHLIGFVGMVVVLLGVVVDGLRRTRPGRSAGNTARELHDAVR